MEKNDGGPAFPVPNIDDDGRSWQPKGGMSLRDWIAGQALNGMLAHATRYRPRVGASRNWHEAIAEEAYEIADAMLAARGGSDGR
ncbi:hypothetical protein KPL78_19340 [Roseomonas sp. HJA6]|uniref:dATP/dGTP diphosphohydrolase N-terminal domain-containing protein n=1 Tax=Roseomonas alba TaxID=2846776 RepID=A0ABS7AFS2_9PROT|nr:hypothetical protein [Neoroseomonas alba]MBW6400024.1 hypothetical protein [Neoroseomonas alba]